MMNQGKGRFAGFSFANRIKWDTVCAENGKNVQYSISVYSENKNEYEVTEKALTERSTGTTVIIGSDTARTGNDFSVGGYTIKRICMVPLS